MSLSFIRYCLSLVLDFWSRSGIGKAMSVIVPSLLQVIHPSSPPPTPTNDRRTPHHPRHVAETGRNAKSMEALAAEVKKVFEAPLGLPGLLDMSTRLQEEFREKLQASTLSMLPSFQHALPSGEEMGDIMALDVGGSTFRAALIRLGGKGHGGDGLQVRRMRTFVIDENVRRLVGRAFFDWMASRIGEMLSEYNHINGTTNARLQMGLTWSFPIQQTSPRHGRLLKMGKGFTAGQGTEGEDLGALVMDACRDQGINVELCAILNDGEATLLAQAYRDATTRMSLILGTGINAAIYLPVSTLGKGKFGQREDEWYSLAERTVVNAEVSMFGKEVFPTSHWDDLLNANHKVPDYQPLEYLVTGRYLGEIARLILIDAIQHANLFDGEIPSGLNEPYEFETRVLATFESDTSPNLSAAKTAFLAAHPLRNSHLKKHDLHFIRDIARLISRRAAAYLATSLHALWSLRLSAEGLSAAEATPGTIACDGSMVEKYPGFRAQAQEYLDELCMLSGAQGKGMVVLEMTPESSIFGAAVAVTLHR